MARTGDRKEYEENKAFLESFKAGKKFLEKNDPKTWARYELGQSRVGHYTTNIIESLNSWIKEIREFKTPARVLLGLMEFLQEVYHRRYREDTERADKPNNNNMPPRVEKFLKEFSEEKSEVEKKSDEYFLVTPAYGSGNVRKRFGVMIKGKQLFCSCLQPQEFGYPCTHGCAVLHHLNVPFEKYAEYFHPARRFDQVKQVFATPIVVPDINTLKKDGTLMNDIAVRAGRKIIKRKPSNGEDHLSSYWRSKLPRWAEIHETEVREGRQPCSKGARRREGTRRVACCHHEEQHKGHGHKEIH